MAVLFEGLAQALLPCALGLLVALVAMGCYRYLLAEVCVFDVEMENETLRLVNELRRAG